MNTKTEQVSSGLVAVAWSVLNGEHTPLARLSDAEAIIVAKDAEILEQCRINGRGAERELHLLAQVAAKDAEIERLKAMLPDIPKAERECRTLEDWKARALYFESEYASCSHGFNLHAGKQAERIRELEEYGKAGWATADRYMADYHAQSEKVEKQSAALKLAGELLPKRIPNGFVSFGKYYSEQEDLFADPYNKMSRFKKQYLTTCEEALAAIDNFLKGE